MAENNALINWENLKTYHENIEAELDKKLEADDIENSKVMNSATGNSISVTDVCDAPLIETILYGKSTQDGTPTPDEPVDIVSVGDDGAVEVTACGKNLYEGSQDWSGDWINADQWSNAEETYNGLIVKTKSGAWRGMRKYLFVNAGRKYIFSSYVKTSAATTVIAYANWENEDFLAYPRNISAAVWIAEPDVWQRVSVEFVCTQSGFINPRIELAVDNIQLSVCGYQLEESAEMTDYEPYKGSTATITSALPLCSVGDVCDELIYNADGTGKIIKRTGVVTFDGSDDENWVFIEPEEKQRIGTNIFADTIRKATASSETVPILCNSLVAGSADQVYQRKQAICVTIFGQIFFCITELIEKELSEWCDWLASNPLTVVYQLAEPQEIELSAAEMSALRTLQSYSGVTNVYNDESAEMTIKYWCDGNINALLDTKAPLNHTHTPDEVGLGNVENKSSETIRSELTKANVTDALGYTPPTSDTTYTHPNSGATAGTYRSVTVNAQGHVTAGSNPTISVEQGGTGATTANEAANIFINALPIGSDIPVDADYYVSQYMNGGTTNTNYYRRPVSKLWEYIKGKISSILGLTATQYNGNAKTATTATNATKVNNLTVKTAVPANAKFTDTTYSNMTAATASAAGKAGLVPAPAAGKQTSFLRGDGTWVVPTDTTYSNFVKSGTGAKAGLVPAPSTTAGTTKYLREDGTWAVPPDTNTTYTLSSFGITATAAELNKLDGVTATAAELNKLDGVTATAAELNYVDGVTSNIQSQLNAKPNIYSMGSSSNTAYYTMFARTSNSNPTNNIGATLLVTDLGNFGGTKTGAWLIQLTNRGSTPTMAVTTLQPHNSGTVTFGYYKDSTNRYFYFGAYTSAYRADFNVTVLRNTGVTIQDFGDTTSAPSGWTAVTPRVLQDTSTSYVPLSGGTMTGALIAQSNTNYTTAQVRNVTMSTEAASGGSNGQIHFQYS